MFSTIGLFLYSLALLAVLAGNVRAQGLSAISGAAKVGETGQGPWTIQADKLMHDQDKQLYQAEGNVKIISKDRVIEADYASIDDQTRQADLTGNVTVQYGRNWLKGEHVIWNLDTETGWLDSGVMFFSENNFFVQGKSISKLSATEFDLKEGFVTSCNPADPAWKIQFNSMKVTVGGTAWTRDASLWAQSWPVGYWPLLGLPVETERQSGFLLPLAGKGSLLGYSAEIPYYWAFREDMDATFYAHYMSRRGFMGGIEYRIDNADWGKGIWMFNYLDDQASQSFLSAKGYPFQTEDRYWVRGKQDMVLPWGIEAKLDLDFVSDRNFLQEFMTGSSSWMRSSSEFNSHFGRDILYDWTSLVRESDAYFEKRGESQLLSLDVRYWENLESAVRNVTTQELPSVSYSIIPTEIGKTPFYYGLGSSVVNYWREDGDSEQRLDVYPRAYYPMHWGNYLDIQPSVGLRGDAYSFDADTDAGRTNGFTARAAPDVEVDMSTRLNREFAVDFWNFTAMQHAIRPEVSYEYAAQTTSGPFPRFDRLDEDQARNGIRYGFTTFLTGKEVTSDAAGDLITTYREIVRFRVFQFFNVQQPAVEDLLFDTNGVEREGFSPVGFRLDIMPQKYLTVSYDLDMDLSSTGHGQAQDLTVLFDSTTGYSVRVDYEQIPNLAVNEIGVISYLKAYKDIYVNTWHDYSLDTGLLFMQGYGIRYIKGCWGFGIGYEKNNGNESFVFSIDLMGIGGVGSQPFFFGKPIFGESLPGYQHPEMWTLPK